MSSPLLPAANRQLPSKATAQSSSGELAVRAQNVTQLRDVVAISLGGEHGVVLRANGQLEFFGNDDYGQCTLPRTLPRIIAVACGTLHTVVVAESGQMYAWGRDSYQQTHVPDGVLFRT